jgi:hypothetical protein
MLTGFHHVTLRVTDLSCARAFYEGVPAMVTFRDPDNIQWELFELT